MYVLFFNYFIIDLFVGFFFCLFRFGSNIYLQNKLKRFLKIIDCNK